MCGALLLKSEAEGPTAFAKCCAKGKVSLLPKFASYLRRPGILTALMADDVNTDTKHLMNHALLYNNEFSFGILTTHSDPVPYGIQVIKVNGQITMQLKGINDYDHNNTQRSKADWQNFRPLAQSFCMDPEEAIERRLQENIQRKKKLKVNLIDLP